MIYRILLISIPTVLWGILPGCIVNTQKQPGDIIINYPAANDSILVHITDLSSASDTVHFVYYGDESLKSGSHMEELIEANRDALTKNNYVFVGMGHYGNYRVKRRRDFISYDTPGPNYGQADAFFNFLKSTIIPLAEKKYSGKTIDRSFIGHSLGGLFAVYLLVNDDSVFKNLYALSPSLWIDDYLILKKESEEQSHIKSFNKNFWISCGSNETINRIKYGVNRFEDTLAKRNYPGIHYNVTIYDGENHNSSVMPTLQQIFSKWSYASLP